MSIRSTIQATCDLARPLTITHLHHKLISGDDRGDLFELTVLRNGEPVDLTGAGVVGYFIRRADDETVIMNGTANGSKAELILPASCYAKAGQFILTIKIARHDERHAVYVAEGAVRCSSTDAVIDPGHVIPSLEELLAQVARIESTIQAAETATERVTSAVQQAEEALSDAETATREAADAAQAANEAAAAMEGLTVEASDGEAAGATVSDVDGHKHIAFTLRAGRDGRDGEKGEQGLPNIVKGKAYDSLEALESGVPEPAEGDQYNVGTEPPYNVYRWTGSEWEDQGVTRGPKGDPGAPGKDGEKGADGKDGVTFTPSVDQEGNLSWTNDGEQPNPETVNIRGPQGEPGTMADIPYADRPAQNLGVAAAGVSEEVSRADHVHKLPTAEDIQAVPVTRTINGKTLDNDISLTAEDVHAADSNTLSLAFKASCGANNEILYDDVGKPSVMVRIPKMTYKDLGIGDSTETFPAFIVDGKEVPEIYISKYQNIVDGDRAYSLPGQEPKGRITFEDAITNCSNKGKGWHLMTRMEWMLLAHWSLANGATPRGNNNYGKDVNDKVIKAIPCTTDGGKTALVLTGTGPVSWSHDGTSAGVWDLAGNIWEWSSGIRTVNGEIQILKDNDAANPEHSQSAESELWMAIDGTTGELIKPDGLGTTENSIKFDKKGNDLYLVKGQIANYKEYAGFSLEKIICEEGIVEQAKKLLQVLGFLKTNETSGAYNNDVIGIQPINGEALGCCGGCWSNGAGSGIFQFRTLNKRGASDKTVGFRSAYIRLDE